MFYEKGITLYLGLCVLLFLTPVGNHSIYCRFSHAVYFCKLPQIPPGKGSVYISRMKMKQTDRCPPACPQPSVQILLMVFLAVAIKTLWPPHLSDWASALARALPRGATASPELASAIQHVHPGSQRTQLSVQPHLNRECDTVTSHPRHG